MLTRFEILSLILSFIAVLLIPSLILMVRAAMKWTRVEDNLKAVIGDLDKLVKDKDRIHADLVAQMKSDRDATNKRLVWLERNVWSNQRRRFGDGLWTRRLSRQYRRRL
jgi:hypothetical protein